MALLKFPKLLRKQYLGHSILWQAYLNGHIIDHEVLQLNSQLFSAYVISQISKKSIVYNSQQYRHIYHQFNTYYNKNIKLANKQDGITWSLQKTKSFFDIHINNYSNTKNYILQLLEIYNKNNETKLTQKSKQVQLQQTAQNQQPIPNQQQNQPSPSSSFPSKPTQNTTSISTTNTNTNQLLHYFIQTLSRIQKQLQLDYLDLLIIQTLPTNLTLLTALSKLKIYYNDAYTAKCFKAMLIEVLAKGEFNIAQLKQMLSKTKNILNQQQQNNKKQPDQLLINALNLLTTPSQKQDIPIQHLQIFNETPLSTSPSPNFPTYLSLLHNISLKFIDWLAIKCLYPISSQSFIIKLQEFCQKINILNLEHLLKIKKKNKITNNKLLQQNDSIKILYQQQKLFHLEIITFLYNQITQGLHYENKTKNNNKIHQILRENFGTAVLNQLRNIKIQTEKKCNQLFKLDNQQLSTLSQSHVISKLIKNIQSILYVIDEINTNNNNDPINLSTEMINTFIQKHLQQLININIILFSNQQLHIINKLLNYFLKTNTTINKKIIQFKKKISKYIISEDINQQYKENRNLEYLYQIKSNADGKKLWFTLKNSQVYDSRKYTQNDKKIISQIKQKLFMMSDQTKYIDKQHKFNLIYRFYH